jgi:HK97 family phage major capsid protein
MDKQAELRKMREQLVTARKDSEAILVEASVEGVELNGELLVRFENSDNIVADLDRAIVAMERNVALDAKDAEIVEEREERTGTPQEQYNEVFGAYVRNGMGGLNPEQRMILAGKSDSELRAQSVGTGSAGGFTVPEGFWNRVAETKLAFSSVASVANVITTADGADLPWMTNDDTGNVGAILAENTQITEQDVTFGVRTLGAYLYTSKLIRVSYQLMQDSAIDIEGFLARKMGERLGRIHNTHQTNGTGSAQPEGIVTGATTGKTTGSATAITYNEIVDLIHSVDPAYRSTNAKFMFSDSVLSYLRKIVDDSGGSGLGRPIWEPSVQVGAPNTIHGHPYVINQDMAVSGPLVTTETTMLFGDFATGFVVRDVKGLSVVRLDERYADYLQVGWFAYDRQDSVTDDTAAYKALVQG